MFHNGKKTLTSERKLKSQAKLYNFPRQTIQTESIVLETISTTKPEHTYFQIKAELVYRECSPRQFSGSLAVNSGRIRLGTCLQQKCCRLLDYLFIMAYPFLTNNITFIESSAFFRE